MAKKRKGGAAVVVKCRRVAQLRAVATHRECPYCFGRDEDVATGEHRRFCDFKPGVDAVVFGFPAAHGRHVKT